MNTRVNFLWRSETSGFSKVISTERCRKRKVRDTSCCFIIHASGDDIFTQRVWLGESKRSLIFRTMVAIVAWNGKGI